MGVLAKIKSLFQSETPKPHIKRGDFDVEAWVKAEYDRYTKPIADKEHCQCGGCLGDAGKSTHESLLREMENQKLEQAVVNAALNWYHWHGYIPNLAAAHYEVPLIKATRALMAAGIFRQQERLQQSENKESHQSGPSC